MNTLKTRVMLAAGLTSLGLSGAALAQSWPKYYGYALDSQGVVVRNNFAECWRTGYWTPALAVAECDPALVAKEAPKPEPKVAPAPAPAPLPQPVEPLIAPAPQPVAAPEPAPVPPPRPTEAWRTMVTEKPVRLEGASFATGSSKLLPGAGSKLDEVVNSAKQYPEINLSVTGFTDNVGNAQANRKLSQARADAVKSYLVGKGVAASRISSQGMGADNPIADNGSADGRAKNRRVEIRYTVKEETRVRANP